MGSGTAKAEHNEPPPGEAERLVSRVAARLETLCAAPLEPGLYVVATPIGHLGDITLRALATLLGADVVYCEDTRHTRGLMAAYGLSKPLRAYHEHNAESERPRIIAALQRGERIALVSDAGTPLISDPGMKLVRSAVSAGLRVVSIPGASAVTTALAAAGLATDRFHFAGFLPSKANARRDAIAALGAIDATLVLFEAPGRVAACLADLAEVLGPRPAVIARELTKLHEDLTRAPLDELARSFAVREIKGEIVVLVGPPTADRPLEVPDDIIVTRLRAALATTSLRDAARDIAEEFGVPRKRVYELGLALKGSGP